MDGSASLQTRTTTTLPSHQSPTAVERRSLTGIARAAGETPGLPFAAWRPRQRERHGDNWARTSFRRLLFRFPPRGRSFAACGHNAGRRPHRENHPCARTAKIPAAHDTVGHVNKSRSHL